MDSLVAKHQRARKTRSQCHPDFLKLPLRERLSAGSKCLRCSTSGCSRIAAMTLTGFWNEFRIKKKIYKFYKSNRFSPKWFEVVSVLWVGRDSENVIAIAFLIILSFWYV